MGKQNKTVIDLRDISPEAAAQIEAVLASEKAKKERAYNVYEKAFATDDIKQMLAQVMHRYADVKDADNHSISSRVVQSIAQGMRENMSQVIDLADSYASAICDEVRRKKMSKNVNRSQTDATSFEQTPTDN